MPVAPLVAAFKRRLANLPGPLGGSGEASNGEPVQVEMRVAGEAIDITSFTLVRDDSGQISLTRGMRAEASQTEAAETPDFQLRNTDGRFNPMVPTGPYYGDIGIGRNTEVWWSVPDGLGGKSYRLRGEVSDWSQGWERSGNDVWTDVQVSGLLQRLEQGPAAEHSPIYQAITDPLQPTVVAYWPCEDPTDSTSIASALTNGSRITWTGTPDLASYNGFPASDPLPDLTTATLSGGVARYTDPTATQVRFLAYIPVDGLSDGKVLCSIDQEEYGGATFWELYYTETGNTLVLRQHDSDGAVLGVVLTHTVDVRGRHMYVSVELEESGTGVNRAVRVTDLASGTVYAATDTAAVTQLTRVTRVRFGPASRSAVGPIGSQYLPGVSVGHVTVENAITATTALGVRLNPVGETAGRRIQRLCAEAGIAFQWIGDLDDTVEMGGQDRQNTISLIQECVKADGGMLYETLDVLGLGYRTRASLYNQDPALVLSYTGNQLSQVPTPVGDDRYLANKVTVTVNGVSATYEETEGRLSTAPPPAGVGVYGPNSDSGLPLNLATSDTGTLLDQAAWRVHLGTVNEDRYPRISVNLAHQSFTGDPALKQAVLALRQGDRIQITNPPAWLPPDTIDQLVLGFEEQINHFQHRITLVCAPASPYSSIGVLDAADARIDTDGSELVAAVSDSATALVVAPSPGEVTLWTTDSTDWPFDVRVGGEVTTVTSVTGWLEDTFTRSVSNGWGSPDAGSAWTAAGGVAADFSVNGSAGVHTLSTVEASRRTLVAAVSPDFDLYCDITTSALATGASLFGAVAGRMQDTSTMYMARLEFTTANTIVFVLRRLVADVGVDLGTYTVPVTHVAGAYIRVRLQAIGPRLKAKAWLATALEPPEWHASATDSAISVAHSIGTRSITVTGNTNVNPEIRYDNYRVISPQTLTVTRSVNGCVKEHAAGSDIELAHPTYIGL
ncbi:hypothetical protein [Streptomyces sp. AMCC400023]|uniref:hypothetical protein n=1 Tax=Streptomyces sp. AMCC400023 TaxID=2056258 RepID=UPI001F2A680C|nr:hypothetical protein [Streptomyces sp. AMCC400023]UJV42095.1 hypothetical protein CVT30_21575 [Streptomyces sp. AMCC400023]